MAGSTWVSRDSTAVLAGLSFLSTDSTSSFYPKIYILQCIQCKKNNNWWHWGFLTWVNKMYNAKKKLNIWNIGCVTWVNPTWTKLTFCIFFVSFVIFLLRKTKINFWKWTFHISVWYKLQFRRSFLEIVRIFRGRGTGYFIERYIAFEILNVIWSPN